MRTLKTIVLTLLLLLPLAQAAGQRVDFNKVVVPPEFRARTFEDYLVQLAWMNNPNNTSLANEVEIAKLEYDVTRWDWAKDFRATGSYNETNLLNDLDIRPRFGVNSPQEIQLQRFLQTLVVPRFTLSATLNLGTLIQLPKEKKIAQEKIKIAEQSVNQEKLAVRAAVLEAYANYLEAIEILKERTAFAEQALTIYTYSENLFKKGELKVDEWVAASSNYNTATEGKIAAQKILKLSIIRLEELIGIKWEDAQKMEQRYNR